MTTDGSWVEVRGDRRPTDPAQAGERVRIDRQDAIGLVRLQRAGELTSAWVPDPAYPAIRDLVYALRQAQQRFCRDDLWPAWAQMRRQL